jgi:signal transduction histidine kinase
VSLPDFIRTVTFRWTLLVAGGLAVYVILLFAIVYWRAEQYLIARSDAVITLEAETFSANTPDRLLDAIDGRLRRDPRGVQRAGLFTPEGHRITGNVERIPPDLKVDGIARESFFPNSSTNSEGAAIRGLARTLPNGNILVIGRSVDEGREIAEIVRETLGLGLIPALCLCLAAGGFLSSRAQKRIEEVSRRAQRIMGGDLKQRLPTRGIDDPFDRLATIVNTMLERIETLVREIAGVGNDIAHDLRTPLTRVRIRLERGRQRAATLEELRTVTDQAIAGVDQSLTIITALLRIAEIEQSRRRDGFGRVELAPLVQEIGDLYEPIAEDKGVELRIEIAGEWAVHGDRDLLFEAVANLIDNAVKFTPAGGLVELALVSRAENIVIRVRDDGPGILESEREAVIKRFYRSDKSRCNPGLGLGLSLVAAIVNLHDFRFSIGAGPGCTVEITCRLAPKGSGLGIYTGPALLPVPEADSRTPSRYLRGHPPRGSSTSAASV